MNSEDLSEYIQSFTYLLNRKKSEKLPERQEQNYKTNLLENISEELIAKVYVIIVKKEKALN